MIDYAIKYFYQAEALKLPLKRRCIRLQLFYFFILVSEKCDCSFSLCANFAFFLIHLPYVDIIPSFKFTFKRHRLLVQCLLMLHCLITNHIESILSHLTKLHLAVVS